MDHADFIVYLNKLPPEGLELEYEIADPKAAGIELSVPVEGPLRAQLRVQRAGNEMLVDGAVQATVRLECSRCLKPFTFPVESELSVSFAPPSSVAGDDEHQHELSPAELDVEPLVGGGADLRGVIAEQIHLALPLKPLCSEDCRGICPHCGREGADGSCGCVPPAADSRWEALRKLTVP